MSGNRAVWHLADMTTDEAEADPFGTVTYTPGLGLDLTASEEELADQMVRLLMREGRLADQGLRCDLKDGGQDCLTCPAATLDPEEARSRLCRLGKDQSTVERRCMERAHERQAPLRELATQADELSEMGTLDDELAEFLTAVGL